MIILHRYKLIFLKTRKTAGTSVEHFLARHRGPDDIITPIHPPIEGHNPQNHIGWFNPLGDSRVVGGPIRRLRTVVRLALLRPKFFNHMTATDLRRRIPPDIWATYTKFAIERNPWDKVVSMHNMLRTANQTQLSIDDVIERELPPNHPIYTDAASGDLCVDHLIRYENLHDELASIFKSVGLPFDGDLGVRAKGGLSGGPRTRRDDLTSAQIDRIAQRFSREIDLMGYDAKSVFG